MINMFGRYMFGRNLSWRKEAWEKYYGIVETYVLCIEYIVFSYIHCEQQTYYIQDKKSRMFDNSV